MAKQVSMERLLNKLTELVETHEFPVFPGYENRIRKAAADGHAKAQYELFKANGKKSLPPAA